MHCYSRRPFATNLEAYISQVIAIMVIPPRVAKHVIFQIAGCSIRVVYCYLKHYTKEPFYFSITDYETNFKRNS